MSNKFESKESYSYSQNNNKITIIKISKNQSTDHLMKLNIISTDQ